MDKKNKLSTSGKPKSKKFGFKQTKKVDTEIIGSDVKNSNSSKDKNSKKKKNRKVGWKIFRICLFVFLALLIIGTGIVVGVVTGVIDKTESVELEDLQLYKLTSFVYDKDGNQIGTLFDSEVKVDVISVLFCWKKI